jgi:3,4-dihydroxy 2-butanone 4-phosphate synthase/GTP cyclohydrolase II
MEDRLAITRVERALEELRHGRMVILVDDADRENEGDLVLAAEHATPEAINFMARYARGLICLSLTAEQCKRLGLSMMVQENESRFSTAFTVSIEAARGVTTGISAADRATTVLAAISPQAAPEDVVRPGHIFPLRARKGGVLVRTGQTEGSVDLARLAGLNPAGVICEVMNDDGTMARMPDLEVFSARHGLMILSVADIIHYRMERERLVRRAAEAPLPTLYGEMRAIAYENDVDAAQHVALIKGTWAPDEPVLVRVHSRCLTGDVFGSARCDCGGQLQRALRMINRAGKGVFVYLDQEGRGIGLANKLRAYNLQDRGADTVEANLELGFKPDLRDYGIGAQILRDLGVHKMRLLTNNPQKIVGLSAYDLEVVARVPIELPVSERNADYMRVKRDKMGHLLSLVGDGPAPRSMPAVRRGL